MNNDRIYDTEFVRSLFDEMAKTYGVMNLVSSFGFAFWWRRQCARAIPVAPDSIVVDFMAGMGELCTQIAPRLRADGKLIALDISPVMCGRAKRHRFPTNYEVLEAPRHPALYQPEAGNERLIWETRRRGVLHRELPANRCSVPEGSDAQR